MPGEKHPIIAHGELYVEPIVKKSRPIDKSIPHEYEDAKQRILSDISNITEKIEIQEEFFLDEKILCVRMEPKFEAKSYVPASITQVSDSISLVGGRKYRFVDNQGDPQSAKLYFTPQLLMHCPICTAAEPQQHPKAYLQGSGA